jgi:hypothetical protein
VRSQPPSTRLAGHRALDRGEDRLRVGAVGLVAGAGRQRRLGVDDRLVVRGGAHRDGHRAVSERGARGGRRGAGRVEREEVIGPAEHAVEQRLAGAVADGHAPRERLGELLQRGVDLGLHGGRRDREHDAELAAERARECGDGRSERRGLGARDHRDQRQIDVRLERELAEQGRLLSRLAGEIVGIEARREVRIGGRVVLREIEPAADRHHVGATRAEHAVEPVRRAGLDQRLAQRVAQRHHAIGGQDAGLRERRRAVELDPLGGEERLVDADVGERRPRHRGPLRRIERQVEAREAREQARARTAVGRRHLRVLAHGEHRERRPFADRDHRLELRVGGTRLGRHRAEPLPRERRDRVAEPREPGGALQLRGRLGRRVAAQEDDLDPARQPRVEQRALALQPAGVHRERREAAREPERAVRLELERRDQRDAVTEGTKPLREAEGGVRDVAGRGAPGGNARRGEEGARRDHQVHAGILGPAH